MLELAILGVFPFAVALAASMDLLTMKIPNRISLALIVAFFAVAPFVGLGLDGIAWHIACGISVLALGFALFACGIFGGGDAKLLAAVALWLGFADLPLYMMMVALMGGLLSMLILLYRRLPLPESLMRQDWALHLHQRSTGVPYGIALGGAALWIYPKTQWVTPLLG